MRRSILALGTAVALAACSEAPTQSSAVRPEAAIYRTETSFRMFRTACDGDLVTLAGMTKVTVIQQNGVWSAILDSEGQGAGQHGTYTISWLRTYRFVEGGATTESSTEVLRMKGAGSTPDSFIRGITTVTLLPDGSVSANVDFSNESCSGR